MVNFEQLETRALRAYEVGRIRMASRVLLLLVPVALICLLEQANRGACGCCAAALLVVSVWLRWKDRAGVKSVARGLLGGVVPLAFALVLPTLMPACTSAGLFSACTAFSLVLGVAAGAVVAMREVKAPSPSRGWVAAATVATLAGSMGCIRLGLVSVVFVALGVVAGRAAASRMRPAV